MITKGCWKLKEGQSRIISIDLSHSSIEDLKIWRSISNLRVRRPAPRNPALGHLADNPGHCSWALGSQVLHYILDREAIVGAFMEEEGRGGDAALTTSIPPKNLTFPLDIAQVHHYIKIETMRRKGKSDISGHRRLAKTFIFLVTNSQTTHSS